MKIKTTTPFLVTLVILLTQTHLCHAATTDVPTKTNEIAAQAVTSQTVATQADTPSPEQLHQELRALKTKMENAINAMDVDTIVANVADDIVFTTMNGDVVHGRAEVKKYFETMMKGDKPRVIKVQTKFEVDDIANLYGNNFAVAFGTSKDHYVLAGGDIFDVQARWSSTMVRKNTQWQVANFHYSTNMFDNPVLEAQRNIGLKIGGGIAVILAFAAFWLGRIRGKKLAAK